MPRAAGPPGAHRPPDLGDRRLPGGIGEPACVRCGTISSVLVRFCPACGEPAVPLGSGSPRDSAPAPLRARAATGSPRDSAPAPLRARAATEPQVAGVGSGARPAARPGGGSLVGRVVGDFAIDAAIGGGSFGTVYRGRQLGLDRPVAIKVPTHEIAADPVQARRFAREARAAARIVHPGVVAIYAVGELDDGRPFLAMQLIDGDPLDRIISDGPVPAARALRIARDIASALAETHAAGVVHRDLKPSNVMWRRDRHGDDRITLVDFGIAVCKPGHADATRLTIAGLIGTPHYMSPEQAQGEQVDARADLYALGCLLFELVTATTPFDGSGFEVLLAHLGRLPPPASERNPAVPGSVDQVIARLMAKRPEDRPASADAVVAMLDEAIAALDDRRAEPAAEGLDLPEEPDPRDEPGPRQPNPELGPAEPGLEADLLDDAASPARPRPARGALAALVAVALSGIGFAVYQLHGAVDANADDPAPRGTAPGALVSPTGEPLRLIPRDDGELIVRTIVPEVIRANLPIQAHVEIKNKLGGRFPARQVVVTVEDPQHRATAQTAAMYGGEAGHYMFRHTFPQPGPYIVRIFPSETESVSTIELDVAP
jgi:eukaryotic-like serine/threonine-protein kinase